MQQVIIGAVALMLGIFGIGLLSAIKSQRRHIAAPCEQVVLRDKVATSPKEDVLVEGEMSMAAGGVVTREVVKGKENLAAVGNYSG